MTKTTHHCHCGRRCRSILQQLCTCVKSFSIHQLLYFAYIKYDFEAIKTNYVSEQKHYCQFFRPIFSASAACTKKNRSGPVSDESMEMKLDYKVDMVEYYFSHNIAKSCILDSINTNQTSPLKQKTLSTYSQRLIGLKIIQDHIIFYLVSTIQSYRHTY